MPSGASNAQSLSGCAILLHRPRPAQRTAPLHPESSSGPRFLGLMMKLLANGQRILLAQDQTNSPAAI